MSAKKNKKIEFTYPRPKFFEFQSIGFPYATKEHDEQGEEEGNGNLLKAKFRFPLILSGKFNLVGEFNYNRERLFVPEATAPGWGNIIGKRAGFSVFAERKYENKNFLIAHVSYKSVAENLKFIDINKNSGFSATVVWGKEKDENTKIGVGVSASTNLGRFGISPVLAYTKKFNERNYLEFLLPKRIQYRHLMTNKLYFFSSIELEGRNYALDNRTLNGYNNLELRRSDAVATFGLEREIHDWLWMSFTMGLTKPLNNIIVEQGERGRNHIEQFNTHIQPFVSVSIFTVLPQKLCKKFGVK
ncbi:hypothetical protein QQ008_25595 [Fulvivirgaceae bacterium BMA10]|uniref:Bacterial surface antigen (D15) domain-containing protein n=1 Tax=Splendidivirga corallicola TaxID=3051826 RepID=A0ABT8KVJ2_9BACT|nr:hypothetical protein [Fulvivirgaceae bacterium BMA10]